MKNLPEAVRQRGGGRRSVKASAWEWTKIEAAIKEIERGEYLTLEELKRKPSKG